MNFSVLMSLYNGESSEYLNDCLSSINSQILKPNQIVIVYDGPIRKELDDIVTRWEKQLPIHCVKLTSCTGLGNALNYGLKFCDYDIVCRMDTDDICRNDRFLRQVKILESDNNLALIGSYISEFDSTPSNSHAVRTVPIEHNDICLYAKKRNPFNHMTVAFRKSVVTSLGGYKDEYLYEDYALWIKMLKNGFLTKNIPEALVYARVGNNMELKRGGWKYFTSEVKAQYGFYKIGFLNKQEMIINIVLRAPVRLMPNFMRKIIYRNLLRN